MIKKMYHKGALLSLTATALFFSSQIVEANNSACKNIMVSKATINLPQNNLLIRPKNFIVNPSTGPVHEVMVTNFNNKPFSGIIEIKYDKAWTSTPKFHKVFLKAGETKKISQAITKAIDYTSNSYPVHIVMKSSGGKIVYDKKFITRCFSAPYYEVDINGSLKEWSDAIPVSFVTKGKKTTLRSYWGRDNFYIAVEVQEDKFLGTSDSKTPDCIQISMSGRKETSHTNQFVAVGSNSMWSGDKVYVVSEDGKRPKVVENSQIDVDRDDDKKITTYEIAIPFAAIKGVRPTAGRGLNFSIVVQDPDGTAIRELASIMNMATLKTRANRWFSGEVDSFSVNAREAKFNDRVDFGFCSSLH
ncbi:hypothetical protein AAEX28_00905 [Lentisphaerota bacterium WC36G]|nr:hypothetical protein LJT99_03785 [Lentisphaerae bacterium WC36]